ncbi:MAG: hypothetical protein QOI01_6959 [Mycobacterium sp.]|nr:hypothetical protein [Mycobacterium sp.]
MTTAESSRPTVRHRRRSADLAYAWAPVASWFRHRGARVSMVPTTQSADLRAYYSKHAKNDHLDSKLLGLP